MVNVTDSTKKATASVAAIAADTREEMKSGLDTSKDAIDTVVDKTKNATSDMHQSGVETSGTECDKAKNFIASATDVTGAAVADGVNSVKDTFGSATDATLKAVDAAERSAENSLDSQNESTPSFLDQAWDGTVDVAKSVEEFVEDGVDSAKHMIASTWENTKHSAGWDDPSKDKETADQAKELAKEEIRRI
ncbi:hypothetical protein HA402_010298 [Bradysia odoriphaga]|nr:hypothetical protein HA402_010298 [Bradysia odoriphaga]